VVSNFIVQALKKQPITVYGGGKQTRSFCYVDDLVEGIIRLVKSDYRLPMNIGNPHEMTIREFAETIRDMVNKNVAIEYKPLPVDDPRTRRPDISLARKILNWEPKVPLKEGLEKTIPYFKKVLCR